MDNKLKSLVWGAFVADALALGAHWVYNTGVIDKKFGRVETYQDPLTSYHSGKKKGDFTHYGDQTLVLLASVSQNGGLVANHFMDSWRQFFSDYSGYFDQATKTTLNNLSEGQDQLSSGSPSEDLAGAARIAPICHVYAHQADKMTTMARQQTALTHNNEMVVAAAEFFSRTVAAVLSGLRPSAAMAQVVDEFYKGHGLQEMVTEGMESKDLDTRRAIADFGQMCEIDAAFPSTIHLITTYEDDFKAALVENVMAGGDSSARGMITGMVLGAYHGLEAIPQAWIDNLSAHEQIARYLDRLEDMAVSQQ